LSRAKNPSGAASSLIKVTQAELSQERQQRKKNVEKPVKPLEKPKTLPRFRMPSIPKK
jgi:hypothetical protein